MALDSTDYTIMAVGLAGLGLLVAQEVIHGPKPLPSGITRWWSPDVAPPRVSRENKCGHCGTPLRYDNVSCPSCGASRG